MERPETNIKKWLIFLPLAMLIALLLFLLGPYWLKQARYLFLPPEVTGVQEDRLEPNQLMIPKLGVTAPIIFVTETSESRFQQGLQNGVVHYPNTAKIGEFGNAFIFGHSSDHPWSEGDYKTVFALLPKLKTGDLIIASDKQGKVFRYQIIKTVVVDPDETQYLSPYNHKHKLLTLQTSYPIGAALKRFIVLAELVSP